MPANIDLKSLSKADVYRFAAERGLPKYRANQLLHWMYERNVRSLQEITEFSKALRNGLAEGSYISNLELADRQRSKDGTEKFLFSLEDGQTVESVLIPDKDRLTLCISSQAGCAMGCGFCLTGSMGLVRNLKAHEIIDQIISVNRLIAPGRVTNIVLMGMGEPLANFDEVVEALWRMTGLMGISKRRVTLSTSGLVPKMLELPAKAPDVNLAVSLNATTDEVRSRIMPVNRTYPIKELLDACRRYPLKPRRRITFEYVLIGGVNDTRTDAKRLVKLLKGIPCKVNLIPFNPHDRSGMQRPSEETVLAFQKIISDSNMTVLIRESRGQDILAACGQLRGKQKQKKMEGRG
ncbi:MAG: 23S rRNA (adenine(2503)-C(2))-methyltransferase RlmN [Nitrospirae bacterium]|nr:23S rRNA (adenine(2503)-C(2))-methyltransferase RlmN [Nitrospirota bacterium]